MCLTIIIVPCITRIYIPIYNVYTHHVNYKGIYRYMRSILTLNK